MRNKEEPWGKQQKSRTENIHDTGFYLAISVRADLFVLVTDRVLLSVDILLFNFISVFKYHCHHQTGLPSYAFFPNVHQPAWHIKIDALLIFKHIDLQYSQMKFIFHKIHDFLRRSHHVTSPPSSQSPRLDLQELLYMALSLSPSTYNTWSNPVLKSLLIAMHPSPSLYSLWHGSISSPLASSHPWTIRLIS